MIKKLFTLLSITLLSNLTVNAQNLVVSLKTGSSSTYPTASIRSIKFGASTMRLNKIDGTSVTWNISDVAQYSFTSGTTTDAQSSTNTKDNLISIYPTPTTDLVTIHYETTQSSQVKIEIIDAHGILIETVFDGEYIGVKDFQWGAQQHKGIFYCRITSNNTVVTKPIILQ